MDMVPKKPTPPGQKAPDEEDVFVFAEEEGCSCHERTSNMEELLASLIERIDHLEKEIRQRNTAPAVYEAPRIRKVLRRL
jgi:hypothetical protein